MSPGAPRSPRIEALDWGRMEVAGLGAGKDFKLWPGGGRPWDWGETGTHHVPGIQPADIAELLARGATVVVLSRGRLRRLRICPETLAALESAGVEAVVEETRRAVARYNELAAAGVPVAGLFHSTC